MPKQLAPKHPLAIRWFHWIHFPVLFVLIWSGLMVLWANDVFTIAGHPVLSRSILETLGFDHHLAKGIAWHLSAMWIFAIDGLAYVAYLTLTGDWRHVLPARETPREAFEVLRYEFGRGKKPVLFGKYNAAQRIAYTVVLSMGAGSLFTGIAVYKPMRLSPLATALGGYTGARFIHFWLTIGFLIFFVIHVGQVARAGWNNLRGMITGYEMVEIATPEGEPAA